MSNAYNVISDNTNTIKYAEKSLQICLESGEKPKVLSSELAKMYFQRIKHSEEIELYEKALLITTELGNRNREDCCSVYIGTVYQSVGEYGKARKHLEKLLSIRKEIGDRNGEASS